jgi:hypothetical protein
MPFQSGILIDATNYSRYFDKDILVNMVPGALVQKYGQIRVPSNIYSGIPEGVGHIEGFAVLANGGRPANAVLHGRMGTPLAITAVNQTTGHYRFSNIAAGHFVVSLFDATGTFKSETIHTVVP